MQVVRSHMTPLVAALSLLGLSAASLLSLSSAEYDTDNHWVFSQAVAFGLAWLVGTGIFFFARPWRWQFLPYLFYLAGVLLLASLFVLGTSVAGHQSWLRVGPVSFQPSEWAKVALVVMVSFRLSIREKDARHWCRTLLEVSLWVGVMVALVIAQGDLGTSLLLMATFGALLFLYPFPKKLVVIALLVGISISALSYQVVLSPYQKSRIETFLHPEQDRQGSGYQVTQAKITVGSGGLWGKGYGHGKHHQLHYLPARHSDFIFCVWAEEWGFIGSSGLLVLYALLMVLVFNSAKATPFREGYYLGMFTVTHLGTHIAVNLGGVLGLLPLTGVPLPLVSYGGSAVLCNGILIGLALTYNRAPQRLKDVSVKTVVMV